MTPTVRYNNRKQVLKDRKKLEIQMWEYRLSVFPFVATACFVLGGGLVYFLSHMIGYIYALITGNV